MVLSHDPHIITNDEINLINNLTFDEIQNLNMGKKQVISFDKGLNIIKSKNKNFKLHIDLKSNNILNDVVNKLEYYNLDDNTMVQSWFSSTFKDLNNTNIKTGLVSYYPSKLHVKEAYNNNIDAVIPHYTSPNLKHYVKHANNYGIQCGCWSINDSKTDVINTLETKSDFVITNRPIYAFNYLHK